VLQEVFAWIMTALWCYPDSVETCTHGHEQREKVAMDAGHVSQQGEQIIELMLSPSRCYQCTCLFHGQAAQLFIPYVESARSRSI
jgi:hypothetical protein